MAADFGFEIADTNKIDVTQVSQGDYATPGAYYEAVYQVGPLNQFIPGWESRAYDDIKNQMAASCPSCQIVYCHIQDNGQIIVQWQYLPSSGYAAYVPMVVVYAVILLIGAAIVLYAATVFVNSVTEFQKSAGSDFTLIVIAGVVVAAAVLVLAVTNAYKTYRTPISSD